MRNSPIVNGMRAEKRAVDLVGAALALTVAMPVVAAAALAIRIRMGSPVLFVQDRPGLHGEPFRMYKLRTMTAASDETNVPTPDSTRLTHLGVVLRRWSIDELPALWNVLRGDMSLVGPRPLLMEYLDRYSTEQARRHEVRPGLTGLAQIAGRNAMSWDDRLALDVWYVDHSCMRLDLGILAKTVSKVLTGHGVSAPGHATMPRFTGSRDASSAR